MSVTKVTESNAFKFISSMLMYYISLYNLFWSSFIDWVVTGLVVVATATAGDITWLQRKYIIDTQLNHP